MMISMLIFATALSGVQAAPAAAPSARTLKTLPATTIAYYDVAGKNGSAIEKSLKKMMADPAMVQTIRPFAWNIGAEISKRTEGDKCTVVAAKAKFGGTVNLPRLVDEAKVPSDDLKSWRTYVAGLEADAASNLWYVSDRLPTIEKSLIGLPCDQAAPTWNSAMDKLKADQLAFAKTSSAAKATGKGAKAESGIDNLDKDY